jgi:uncharacterized membrane protein YeaQ/YmgE (transglycosylase-associated protein family)
MSLLGTILIGIAGSLLAGVIAYSVLDWPAGAGLIGSVISTMGLVYAVRTLRRRRVRERPVP